METCLRRSIECNTMVHIECDVISDLVGYGGVGGGFRMNVGPCWVYNIVRKIWREFMI